jgi:D-alanyl-D-alanine carboxypeptidase (penicillin-binding protein 5/6)
MLHTTLGSDASGLDPATTSTVADLFELGKLAMQNDTVRQIVGLTESDFPGVGTITNTNYALGENGVIGIKTGHTDSAGENLLFAMEDQVTGLDGSGHSIIVVGVILGATSADEKFSFLPQLAESLKHNLSVETVLGAGQVVARYNVSDGATYCATVTGSKQIVRWNDETITVDSFIFPLTLQQLSDDASPGSITVNGDNITLDLDANCEHPPRSQYNPQPAVTDFDLYTKVRNWLGLFF